MVCHAIMDGRPASPSELLLWAALGGLLGHYHVQLEHQKNIYDELLAVYRRMVLKPGHTLSSEVPKGPITVVLDENIDSDK